MGVAFFSPVLEGSSAPNRGTGNNAINISPRNFTNIFQTIDPTNLVRVRERRPFTDHIAIVLLAAAQRLQRTRDNCATPVNREMPAVGLRRWLSRCFMVNRTDRQARCHSALFLESCQFTGGSLPYPARSCRSSVSSRSGSVHERACIFQAEPSESELWTFFSADMTVV